MISILIATLLAATAAPGPATTSAAPPAAPSQEVPGTTPAALPARTIKMTVTKKGFHPDSIKVKKGQPLHLLITRKTDETCATEIVFEDTKASTDLPLNKEVAVDYTPTTSGEIGYACEMGMVRGVLVVN
jgi:plastocyanin domain-containing protein